MALRGKETNVEKRFDFDALAKTMASGLPRREALRRLGGGLTGALLASMGLGKAWGLSPNTVCEDFCQNDCGLSRGHGNAFSKCVNSCRKCQKADHTVLACPPSAGDEVVCSACAAGQVLCLNGSCCDIPCCGSVCCEAGQQCDSESSICF
jgi:hypothetical protein